LEVCFKWNTNWVLWPTSVTLPYFFVEHLWWNGKLLYFHQRYDKLSTTNFLNFQVSHFILFIINWMPLGIAISTNLQWVQYVQLYGSRVLNVLKLFVQNELVLILKKRDLVRRWARLLKAYFSLIDIGAYFCFSWILKCQFLCFSRNLFEEKEREKTQKEGSLNEE
jgi:hypothetical protein